jgi:hypothetical protein
MKLPIGLMSENNLGKKPRLQHEAYTKFTSEVPPEENERTEMGQKHCLPVNLIGWNWVQRKDGSSIYTQTTNQIFQKCETVAYIMEVLLIPLAPCTHLKVHS